ncbi:MAG: HPr(Ser) kinase/phosphatase [Oscillospiraceae bacterium]|nr:HPr(Ser) kinase/phosphatase [Oscillospiraceae bacterium]
MAEVRSIPLKKLIEAFDLKVAYAPEGYEKIPVTSSNLNRPGLQLMGFYDHFVKDRLQVIGMAENTYLDTLGSTFRKRAFKMFFAQGNTALIYCRGSEPHPECYDMAQRFKTPVLISESQTANMISSMVTYLSTQLAPMITRHGVLVDIYGEGVLIIGESGVGKSETAVELIKRGHRLIADDAVEIRRVTETRLVGSAPELIRHYMELRGIGVVDVRRLFGTGAVMDMCPITMVANVVPWDDNADYDRMGTQTLYTTILEVKVPAVTIPVKPGRNLAVILEVAAMSNRDKSMGYNAAQEFSDQIDRHFAQVLSEQENGHQ